jgi:hypothetical protein
MTSIQCSFVLPLILLTSSTMFLGAHLLMVVKTFGGGELRAKYIFRPNSKLKRALFQKEKKLGSILLTFFFQTLKAHNEY